MTRSNAVPRRAWTPSASTARRSLFALLAVFAVVVALAAPAAATSSRTPDTPTGMRVAAVTSSSFTITANPARYATSYRIFVSLTRSDVYVANIARAMKSPTSTTPRVTMSGLKFTTQPYYYRFAALNGSKIRYAATFSEVSLQPATPTGVTVTSGTDGFHLAWSSGAATGFAIAQAADSDTMSQGRRDYRIGATLHQFTPYGLLKGTTYYFRVAALNGSTRSAYSAQVAITPAVAEFPVRVMTYNVLELTNDGTAEGGQTIAPWSQRKVAAAALIKQADPDVVAVQEAAAWVTGEPGVNNRQIDSLVSALGGTYTLADTENTYPSQPGHIYFRTGDYVLYKSSEFTPVGGSYGADEKCAGKQCWALDDTGHFAVYQELQSKVTGARFLYVCVHTTPVAGSAGDAERKAETQILLTKVDGYRTNYGVPTEPVVLAGDFNSVVNANHAFDGPGQVMHAANYADAFDTAQSFTNGQYNSANQYQRTPPAFGQSIDHVYAPQGVGIRTWGLAMRLSGGKFVGVIPSDHNPLYSDVTIPYVPANGSMGAPLDVPPSNSFYADVVWLLDHAITTGYADGGYHPDAAVSRQAMAAFLYRFANPGEPDPTCSPDAAAPFPDVPAASQFCGVITWLVHAGVTSGYSDGGFHPRTAVSRQAMAAFMYKLINPSTPAAACTTSAFPDVSATNTFCGEITWLVEQGITHGYPDGTFQPNAAVSRQAMAAFLHRLSELGS